MKSAKRIIVALDANFEWARDAARGVAAYAARRASWQCDFTLVAFGMADALQRAPRADGLIVDSRYADAAAELKIPVVVLGDETEVDLPRVCLDRAEIARLAARHLLERGFRQFAYFTGNGPICIRRQCEVFASEVESRGCLCEKRGWNSLNEKSWWPGHRQLMSWLKGLPKPIGLFAGHDAAALEMVRACRDADIAVPDEVAVLGVHNDELRCHLCRPSLSSIETGCERMGFVAAQLLHRIIQGKTVDREVLVPPRRVVMRGSTDIVAVDDPRVAAAAKYIRRHVGNGVNVKQLVQEMKVGRRTLETAFRKELGRTIHQEVVRVQLHRACRLLAESNVPLAEVASACGIRHPAHLGNFIKKQMGVTPGQYRRAESGQEHLTRTDRPPFRF